jgi:hypothetical protein
MQQDITLYVVCGLAALCSVLLVVGFFTFRFAFRYIGLFTKSIIRSDQEDEDAQKSLRLPRRRIDLRAKAQSADFDSAVAQAQSVNNPGIPAQAAPPSVPPAAPSPFDDAPPQSGDFRHRLRRRGQSREENEALYGSEDDDDGLLGL